MSTLTCNYYEMTATQKELFQMEHDTYEHNQYERDMVRMHGWNCLATPARQQILADPIAWMYGGGSWYDMCETLTMHEMLMAGGAEALNKHKAELEEKKASWKSKIINTHAAEREKNFARILKENGIKKMSGPCCWTLKADETDHTCWSHEFRDAEVEKQMNDAKKYRAELAAQLDGLMDAYLSCPNHVTEQYGEQVIEMIEFMDGQIKTLEENAWQRPHKCIWLHEGEVGWKAEWKTKFAWTTKEQRSRMWKPFWNELREKEAFNKKVTEKSEGQSRFVQLGAARGVDPNKPKVVVVPKENPWAAKKTEKKEYKTAW